ncbi:MAG: glycogen/starch synthase [Myxococcota bacterium]
MNILFVSEGVAPLSGQGSVAELSGALPKALRALEHQSYVLSPLYRTISPEEHSLARRLLKLKHSIGGTEYACELWTGRTIGGAELVFVGHESFTGPLEAGEGQLGAALFIRSAVELIRRNENGYELVHGHGWLGAAVVSALKAEGVAIPTVVTAHASEGPSLKGDAATIAGQDPLRTGLEAADAISEVAPGLLDALGLPSGSPTIRGGIDTAVWNPLTDPKLGARFDPVDLSGKASNKRDLQKALGLAETNAPLFLVHAAAAFEEHASLFLRNDVQLAVVGGGARFEELAGRWPDRCALLASDQLHAAHAAADFVLTLDATTSLIAHRYGALPITPRSTSELLVDCDAKLRSGTALLTDSAEGEDLLAGMRRAAGAFVTEGFDGARRRVMRIDHGWERCARQYARLYSAAQGALAA